MTARFHPARALAAAALLPLAACGGPRVAAGTPPTDTARAAAGTTAPAATLLFAVEAGAEGTFRAGEPLRVHAAARARLPVDTAEIRLLMPEVAVARTSGWGSGFQPPAAGVRLPAMDSAIVAMRPGQPVRVASEVRLPAGYSHVLADARARALAPGVRGATAIQDLASESLWLWIGENGGYASREHDETRYPLAALPQPRPLRPLPAGVRMRALLDSARADPRSHAVVLGSVQAPDGRPAAGVTVHVRAYMERCPGRGAAEETVRTDAAGRFRVRLRSYVPRAFSACVAVHADPPGGGAWRHAALRVTLAFAGAASAPDSARVPLRLAPAEAGPR